VSQQVLYDRSSATRSLRPVAETSFEARSQLGKRAAVARHEKQRIVAKPAAPAHARSHPSAHTALDGHHASSRRGHRDHTPKLRAAPMRRNLPQRAQQFAIIRRIVRLSAGIPRGAHPWRTP